MGKIDAQDLNIIKYIPHSSNALREKVENILKNTTKWSAKVSGIDKINGNYKIIIQGSYKEIESIP